MEVKSPKNVYDCKPALNHVFKDPEKAKHVHINGYMIQEMFTPDIIEKLRDLYYTEHKVQSDKGGMFYSVYSSDVAYRKRINLAIAEILKPVLETHFKDYKNIVNTFVMKASGKQSEFYVHQDTTALDEMKYSPLTVWIPLQDIHETNGAITLIEKTQWFFSPFRSVSYNFPFDGILNTVRKYLKPVYMKTGEALVFDPRVIHNSEENSSGEDRIAIICGIFPKDAVFTTCFKDPSSDTNPIEIIEHTDDYPLENINFYYNCHIRPTTGTKVREETRHFPNMDAETFETLCAQNQIEQFDPSREHIKVDCNLIAEPDGINKDEEMMIKKTVNEPVKQRSGLFSWFKR